MKFILKINGTVSPKAAYVGWTPAKCTLAIDGFSGESPIAVTIIAGDHGFEGKLSLYENNVISAEPVDRFTHNFDGQEEFTFYIAGKYPNASVAKKDTFLKVESQDSEIPPVTANVMVRIRKDANTLSDEEISLFLESFVRLNTSPTKKEYNGDYTATPGSLLDELVLMHTYDTQYEIHSRTSFHPWHRAFQMHLERELQNIDPRVTIPYWKFDEKAERVFTRTFVGETKQTEDPDQDVAEKFKPSFDQGNPLKLYAEHTVWGPLRRAYRKLNPAHERPENIYPESQIIDGAQSSEYFLYWSRFEERRSHNQAHNAFTGHVVDIGRDPVDPLFFMMHGNVDRLWALWQEKHNRYNGNEVSTYPFQHKYAGERGEKWALLERLDANDGIYQVNNDDLGNFAEDTLWPWDWDAFLSRPMRKWSSNDPNYGTGVVPQINIDFPASATSNYPNGAVTVKSTIDYQGRLNNLTCLGFDYDCIPYFDHDKESPQKIAMVTEDDQNQLVQKSKSEHFSALTILNDKDADFSTRLKAIQSIDETSEIFLDTALNVIADSSESVDLRSDLIHEVRTAKRSNRHFPSRKPRFFDILRGLLTSESPKLRFQAIEILAAADDGVVQEFLVGELKKDEGEFVSKPDAIFFLRQNTKPQHAKLFLELFNQSSDSDVRKAAIEGLDNDPNSIDLLERTVLDEQEDFKVREAGALSLHHIDHEKMNEVAAQIIAKPENEGGKVFFTSFAPAPGEVDFKTGLLNMLTFTGDSNRLKQNEGLKASLQHVIDRGTVDRSDFRGSFETMSEAPLDAPTVLEKMATKLLNRLEKVDEDE